MSLRSMKTRQRFCWPIALVCGLLIIAAGEGAAAAQAPAPAASPSAPSTPAAAAPVGQQMTPEEVILQLKDALNQRDMQIAQLIANGATCRGELLNQERAALNAKKAADAAKISGPPAAPTKPDASK